MTAQRIMSIILFGVIALATPVWVSAQEIDTYLWEKPVTTAIDQIAVNAQIATLHHEIDQILAAPPLAPLRLNYADLPDDAYWLYVERGRIIETLAAAYPYLEQGQQEQVRAYVQTMLESGDEAPWNTPLKNNGEGAERQLHQHTLTMGRFPHFPDPGPTPTLHVLYGLWLYADRSGDWETINRYWDSIQQYYEENKDVAILYGQLSGFVGMARMAYGQGDEAAVATVTADAAAQFAAARDLDTIAARQQNTTFGYFYDERKAEYFPGQPWMFLNVSPEVMRFIGDDEALRTQALDRVEQFGELYPIWWLMKAPYFTRWTGDEGVGLTSETFGIHMPFERWIKATPSGQLLNYMRSAPVGIGDSYWIEALVTAIEASGEVCWEDVRASQPACGETGS